MSIVSQYEYEHDYEHKYVKDQDEMGWDGVGRWTKGVNGQPGNHGFSLLFSC